VLLQENLPAGAVGRELPPYPQEQKYADFIGASLHPVSPVSGKTGELSKGELIVWPEAPADFFTITPLFQTEMSGLSRYAAAPVIVGSVGVDIDATTRKGYHEFGSAAVFNSDGSYLGRYDKIHRVPWGEYVPYAQFFSFAGKLISGVGDMEAGTQAKIFPLNGHNVGIFICYESIFGDEVRHFVRNGAQVLVNISDDGWYGDSGAPWQHLDMAQHRHHYRHRPPRARHLRHAAPRPRSLLLSLRLPHRYHLLYPPRRLVCLALRHRNPQLSACILHQPLYGKH
jgi:apolipoprotein N-acyltransferase